MTAKVHSDIPSGLGQRRFIAWMRFVREIGWPRLTWSALADLWWLHHDENGAIK